MYKISKDFRVLLLLLWVVPSMMAQDGFVIDKNKKRDKISFQLVNNLVVIPIELNGASLSFLLDTGVSNTILFSLSKSDSLEFRNPEWIKVRGLGSGVAIDALKSSENNVRIGDAVDDSHELYFIFEENLDFSKRMGVEIHGIIGYDFFKNFVVKINYDSKVLTFTKPEAYNERKCRKCTEFPLFFHKDKPYIQAEIFEDGAAVRKNLLVDSGASDAVWLFEDEDYIEELPKNYFNDFLGLGLSGAIYGKRSKLEKVALGEFIVQDATVSFPDKESIQDIALYDARDGTLGAGILKRFTTIFDYSRQKMYLKRNLFYKDPFYYNMSGLTLEHDGVTTVKDVSTSQKQKTSVTNNESASISNAYFNPSYYFYLAPKYVVAEIRPDSPAALQGFKVGDEIVQINGKIAQKYELNDLTLLFSSRPGKKISFDILREGKIIKKKITLKKVL